MGSSKDYIERELDRQRGVGKTKYSNAAEKIGINYLDKRDYPDITNKKHLSTNNWKKDILNPANEDYMNNLINRPGNAYFGIAENVTNASPFGNPAQYTIETLEKIKQGDYDIFAIDTEFTIGSTRTPLEIGFHPLQMSDGKISFAKNAQTFAVQLDEKSLSRIDNLLNKMDKAKKAGRKSLFLSNSDYVTLKQLANYAGKGTIDAGKIASRPARASMIGKHNILEFIDDIKEGYESLDPRSQNCKALNRNDVTSRITRMMMDNGWKIGKDPMFLSQNGLGADVQLLADYFSKDSDMYNLLTNGRHIDTLSIARTFYPSMLPFYSGNTKGSFTLNTMVNQLIPDFDYQAHVAGEDAYATTVLFKHLWENENIKDKVNKGDLKGSKVLSSKGKKSHRSKIFSVEGITRQSPLDYVMELENGGWVARDWQNNAVYKNMEFKITKEFETEYSGKKYYGVIMKNVDEDLYSVIARESPWELQNVISQNFVAMDSITNKHTAKTAKVKDKAMREYRNMFTTPKAYSNFDKYTKAAEYVKKHNLRLYKGMPSNSSLKILMEKTGLTQSQARKFKYMYPRLESELDTLLDFKKNVLNKLGNKNEKVIALNKFKRVMDEELGAHLHDVKLNGEIYNTGRLFDFKSGSWKHVDLRSENNLARNLWNIVADTSRNSNANFADATKNMRTFIGGLYSQGVIEKDKASRLMEKIMIPIPFHNPEEAFRGLHDVTAYIASEIMPDVKNWNKKKGYLNIVKNQESLDKRTINKTLKNHYSGIINFAESYFSSDGGVSFVNGNIKEQLAARDKSLRAYVSKFSKKGSLGPTSLEENLTNLVGKLSNQDLGIEVKMANKRKSTGLMLSIYDRETSSMIVNRGTNKTADIFIPLVNQKTDLIDWNGKSSINVLRPVIDKNGRVRLDTYQNKIFDALGYNKVVKNIAEYVKNGDIDRAVSYANRMISHSLNGIPSASRFTVQDLGNLGASTSTANLARQKMIDTNDLLYGIMKKDFAKLGAKQKDQLLREILLNDKIVNNLYGGISGEAYEFKRHMNNLFGNNWSTLGVKGERALTGFFSIGDYRHFGALGILSGTGRENARSAQNYFLLNPDDAVRYSKNYLHKIDNIVTRKDLMGDSFKRLTGKYVHTASYLETTGENITGLNLNTIFMTDKDIRNATLLNNKDSDINNIHFLNRFHTYEDTMFLRTDVAEMYGTFDKKSIRLGEGVEISKRLKYAEENGLLGGFIIHPEDFIGVDFVEKDGIPLGSYKTKHDVILDEIERLENNEYILHTREFKPSYEGMKMQGTHGGTKATARLFTKEQAIQQFGEAGKEIEAILNASTKKMPADFLTSQLNVLMYELNKQILDENGKVTVGKVKKEQMKKQVLNILDDCFEDSKSKRKFSENVLFRTTFVGGKQVITLELPEEFSHSVNANKLINAVSNATNGANKITITGKDGEKLNFHKGLVTTSRMNVDEVHQVFGKTLKSGEGVKIGLRELEFMQGRQEFVNADIGGVIKSLEDKLVDNSKRFETKEMFEALTSTIEKVEEGKYGIVRLTEGAAKEDDLFIDNLKLLPKEGGYSPLDVKGSILDPGSFNGKAYYLELPESIQLPNGKEVDKVLMPTMHLDYHNNKLFPNEIQKLQKDIFDNVRIMKESYTYDDTKKGAKEKAYARLKKSREILYGTKDKPGLINKYYTQMARELSGSHGYLNENVLKKRMPHSARLRFAAVSPDDFINKNITNTLKEGDVMLSRKDFRGMLKGLDKKDVEKMMDMASSEEGFVGIGIRYPTHHYGSVQPVKFRVLDEAKEAELFEAKGRDFMSGNAYVTVGAQVRWGADFDGDALSVFLPQIAGEKSGSLNKKLNLQMKSWFKEEKEWNKSIRKKYLSDIQESAKTISEIIQENNVLGPQTNKLDNVIAVESRLQKQVGIFSNYNLTYRRLAQSVDKQLGTTNLHSTMSYFGTLIEQAPISAKRLGENLKEEIGKLGKEATSEQINELLVGYIKGTTELKEGLRIGDVDKILNASKNLGMFEWKESVGDWVIKGMKGEGERYKAVLGGGTEYLSMSKIRNDLETMMGSLYDKEKAINGNLLRLGVNNINNAEDAFNWVQDIVHSESSRDIISGYYGSELMLAQALGREDLISEIQNASERTFNINQKLKDPKIDKIFKGSTASSVDTESIVSKLSKGNKIGMIGGIAAAAVGGAWMVGSLMGGPSTKRNAQQSPPDVAPSSDGQYIDPTIYAGAPMGAGPTARVIKRGEGYERANIQISGNTMSGMTNEEIAAIVSQEVERQAGIPLDINITSQDNRTTMNKQWMQDQFAKAIKSGFAY